MQRRSVRAENAYEYHGHGDALVIPEYGHCDHQCAIFVFKIQRILNKC